ncbi:glutathione S-transferase [Metarhizium album ARSEF 1941]|uniref:Glutathione S-transferase n=1 Tax=Metarhizium album (strain ARSEF 1941) TaxID=1081103 RepID=A0A0B2WWP7_METAS|nr:glutathione S-transferase [Metarhizium album ARSEF 1941]KHN97270.1 glutathione S-transferase [Metarhizium album ARSEF 1941]
MAEDTTADGDNHPEMRAGAGAVAAADAPRLAGVPLRPPRPALPGRRAPAPESCRRGCETDDDDAPFWVLGGSRPTEADATVYGFVVGALVCTALVAPLLLRLLPLLPCCVSV